jgi:hypothetical protein
MRRARSLAGRSLLAASRFLLLLFLPRALARALILGGS